MEITNSVKARAFAQYLGQRIKPNPKYEVPEYYKQYFDDPKNPGTYECKGSLVEMGAYRDLLILKPLSEITNMQMHKLFGIAIKGVINYLPDAKEKYFGFNESNTLVGLALIDRKDKSSYGFSFDGENFELTIDSKEVRINQAYLFELAKEMGIDLPIVGGKTLYESGLAIYE